MDKHVLVLDVGTTGIKAVLFDSEGIITRREYQAITKRAPKRGWVEQDPAELVAVSRVLMQKVCDGIDIDRIAGMGITNQRETTIVWEKEAGPIYPAIVWEDVRTKSYCADLKRDFEEQINERTGLTLDPYFSASKLHWILENVHFSGDLMFGTVDSWLLWNLCEGAPHVTDCTNASRTMLYNIREEVWDKKLLDLFQVTEPKLPNVLPSQAHFGDLKDDLLGESIPVLAVAGDQQASTYAAGSDPGTTKVTYGTGAFLVQILGPDFLYHPPFFTTLVPGEDCSMFALEAKVTDCGKRVQKALKDDAQLKRVLRDIALEVDVYIQKLPEVPREIIIDGGVVRDGFMKEIQEEVSGIPVRQQDPFDGTSLGIAELIYNKFIRH